MSFLKRYDNGLRVVVKKTPGLFSVSIGVLVNTGSVNETKENNGISHFIEHMMFKGTKKRTAFDVSNDIDKMGAQINAYTSKENTCYYVKTMTTHLEESLEILSDIFFNSTFDDKEIEREKGVVIEEINMSKDSPDDTCYDLLAKSYFGDDGYGRTILGPIENVKSFTRDDIKNYLNKYYTPNNVVISVAGNVKDEDVLALIEKYFVNNFSSKDKGEVYSYKEKQNGYFVLKKDIEQTHIGICFKGLKATDKKAYALNIANVIFGGGMSSRLFQKIREEMGLCYNIYSYMSQYKDNGVVEIYSAVSPKCYETALKEIIKLIKDFGKNGVNEEEFKRGKEQVKSSLIMSQESTSSQMFSMGRYLIYYDKKLNFKKRIKEIDEITLEDVNKIIKEIFVIENVSVALLGPNVKKIKY